MLVIKALPHDAAFLALIPLSLSPGASAHAVSVGVSPLPLQSTGVSFLKDFI